MKIAYWVGILGCVVSVKAFAGELDQIKCEQMLVVDCYKEEKLKPDSSRGGVNASEFCAASAVADCAPWAKTISSKGLEIPSINGDNNYVGAAQTVTSSIYIFGKRLEVKDSSIKQEGYIKYNGELIVKLKDVYSNIVAFINYVPSHAALIYSTTSGGSGSGETYHVVMLSEHNNNPATGDLPYGNKAPAFSVHSDSDAPGVLIDLGFDGGKQISAMIINSQLYIDKKSPSKPMLSEGECKTLSSIIKKCRISDSEVSDCRYNKLSSEFAAYEFRNIISIGQNPGFNSKVFETLCEATCKNKELPLQREFYKTVCKRPA